MRTGILLGLLLAANWLASGQGIITSFAGQAFHSCGGTGDGGPATSAQLFGPGNPVVDSLGNVYFYDGGNYGRIREVTASGTITTIAGGGSQKISNTPGSALSTQLGVINQLAIDPLSQRLCFTISGAPVIACLFLQTGMIQGYGTGNWAYGGAGDGGNVADASFNDPVGIAFDPAGNLYISDFTDMRVRRVDSVTGIITTYAGPGPDYCCVANVGDGGPATAADLYEPRALAYGNGGLYIADYGNFRVRRVDSSTGIITTVAGDGSPFYSASSEGGPAVQTGVSPFWLALDSSGNLFIENGQFIREVDLSGNISTIAGSTTTSGSGNDDVLATQTLLSGGDGLGWDPVANRLLIPDYPSRIRQIFYTPPTTTTFAVSTNPAYPGEQVTLTATVSPTNATGVVRFHQGNLILGSSPVNNGVANFTWVTPSSVGSDQLNAVYGGDPTHNLSASSVTALSVQLLSTVTKLTSSSNPITFGSSITLVATITPATATGFDSISERHYTPWFRCTGRRKSDVGRS